MLLSLAFSICLLEEFLMLSGIFLLLSSNIQHFSEALMRHFTAAFPVLLPTFPGQ